LNNSITKKVAEEHRNQDEKYGILGINIILTSCISLVISAIVLFTSISFPSLFSSPELAKGLVAPILSLPLFNINKNFGAFFTGLRMQKRFAQQRMLRWILISLFIVICIITNQNIGFVMWCFGFSEFILFLINLSTLRKLHFNAGSITLSENLKFGLKSYAAEVVSSLNSTLDIVLVGYFLTQSETGVYSFVVYVAKTLFVFPGIMMQNISPIISSTWASGTFDLLLHRIKAVRKINSAFVSLQLVLLVAFYPLVTKFVNESFQNTFIIFTIASFGAYVFSLVSWSGSMLIMTKKLNQNLFRTIVIILFSIALTFAFTYAFGLVGACIAFSINSIIAGLTTSFFIRKTLGINIVR
jgi:O-antigen/teichoic acid export membrane protein